MNIDEMPPGREMDRLVAERVMGWREDAYHYWANQDGLTPGCWVVSGSTEDHHGNNPWTPSSDISAAWAVVERISVLRLGPECHPQRDGRHGLYKPVIRVEMYEHDDEYSVVIGRCKCVGMDDDIVARQMGGTLREAIPLLICRAALMALGVKEVGE